MIMMRKVLAKVIRDTTPPPGMRRSINDDTVEEIRMCLELISARERELAEERGITNTARPRYVDEPKTAHVIQLQRAKPKADDKS
ncbi:MAG: segregation and condensation protein A [Thiotrichales bacterium]